MAAPNFRLVTRNIAGSKRLERIVEILKSERPDLLLLQEVTLNTAELKVALQNTQYNCESNIDEISPSIPGTAAVWRVDLPNPQVTSLVTCQLQAVQFGVQTFLNVYAPSGSENKNSRAMLFTRDLFPYLLQHQQETGIVYSKLRTLQQTFQQNSPRN